MKKVIPALLSVFIVALMVASSCIFDNREIIFPEIAAIAVGAMISPKMSWNVNKIKIFIYILLCAVCGVLIVKYLPLPVWLQMIIGYALAQLFLLLSKSTFAPMISAMVLPIMLQTTTPVYIISAAFFTALILLFRLLLEKTKIIKCEQYVKLPAPSKSNFLSILLRTLLASPLVAAAILLNCSFAVAPPLLVAFTEFSNVNCHARKRLPTAVALVTCGAIFGSACRYIFTVVLGLPLFLSASVAILSVILLLHKAKMYIPPVGAIAVLAMLIPKEQLLVFPIEIFIGISILSVCAKLCFRTKKQVD